MDHREQKILLALALMVDQYCAYNEVLDNSAMRAGETAFQVLAEYGLVTLQGSCRFADWTDAGRELLNSIEAV
jgi:hypothetical protein